MMNRKFGSVLVAALLAAIPAAAQEWPRFRGPNGSGVAAGNKSVPAEFGPAKNLLWKTAVPFGRSSPVIAGKNIYITASEGEKLVVMALDRASGRIRWRREIQRAHKTPVYKFNDAAAPTPAADAKNVYAFFADFGLIAFDANGKEKWRVPLGPFDTFYGLAASPILHSDTVLLLCDTRKSPFLLALDAKTGKHRWRVARPETKLESYATPVIWQPRGQPAQVVVLGSQRLDAYNVASGERVWWLRGLASLPIGSPIVYQRAGSADAADGVLVASTYGADTPPGPSFDEWLKSDSDGDGRISEPEVRKTFAQFDEFGAIDVNSDGYITRNEWDNLRNAALGNYGLVAVRLGGAKNDVSAAGFAWHNKKASTFVPSPLAYVGLLYVVKSGGIIEAIDAANGEMVKAGRSKEALGEYYASPVAADGKIFFVSEEGKVTVVRAGRDWEILSVNALREEIYATPAIADGRIFIRTRNALYSFGELARGGAR